MARYTEAHNRANQKYQKSHYYRFTTCFPKDVEEELKKKADEYGSINAYLLHLVKKDLGM